MPYSLDQNGAVTWSDDSENVDAGPGGNQSAYGMPSVQDQLTMSLPPVNDSPVPDDIAQSVLHPGSITQPQLAPGQSTGNKQSVSGNVGSSHSGVDFSSGGAFDMAESPTKGLKGFNRDVAEGHNKAIAFGKQLYGGVDANVEEQRQANIAAGDIEAQKADTNAQLTGEFAARQRQDAVDNAADYANIQHKVGAKMADYEASINDLASSTINPGRAYSSLTSLQKGGVLVTAFVTDFLGAKGIKTHGMDYINQAIDRDIQAQRDNIDLKKDVAAGKMNIYQMFKQQGDSDFLAAEKTRGALTTAFQTEVIGKLAAFDSPMARAKVEQANALINQKKLEIKANIAKEVQEQEVKYTEIAVRKRADSLQAGAQAAANKLGWADLQEKKDARLAASKPGPAALDPDTIVTDRKGVVIGTATKGPEHKEAQDRVAGFEDFNNGLAKYQALVREGQQYKGPLAKMFLTKNKARINSLLRDLSYSYAIANNGSRPTDKDYENAEKQFANAGWMDSALSSDDPNAVVMAKLGELGVGSIDKYHTYVRTHLNTVDPELAKQYIRTPNPNSMQDAGAQEAVFTDNRDQKPAVSTPVDKVLGTINSRGGKITDTEPAEQDVIDAAMAIGLAKPTNVKYGTDGSVTKQSAYEVPVWFNKMEDLVTRARDASNKEEAQAAVDGLYQFVEPKSNYPGFQPNKTTKDQSLAAFYLLNELHDNPAAEGLNFKEVSPELVDTIMKYRNLPDTLRD
jgi:hypothetical protein